MLTDFEIKVNGIYYNILGFLIYEYPIKVLIIMYNVNFTNYLFLICYFHVVLKSLFNLSQILVYLMKSNV